MFGPSGPSVRLEVLDGGPSVYRTGGPPEIQVLRGKVTIVAELGFSDPGYEVDATARLQNTDAGALPDLLVDLMYERREGDFLATNWFRTYRITVTKVPVASYDLILRLLDDEHPNPAYRLRILIDTVISVP